MQQHRSPNEGLSESSGSNNANSQRRPTNIRQGSGRRGQGTGVSVVSTDPETVTSTDSQHENLLGTI